MELDAYLAVIASEAARMGAIAEEAGLDAQTRSPLPTNRWSTTSS